MWYLINSNFQNPITGITGKVQFDNTTGERTNFDVTVMELSSFGFNKIAQWNPESDFVNLRSEHEVADIRKEKWQNKTFKIITRIGPPYLVNVKPKEEGVELTGNDRYEGYSKDLMHEILKETLNLNYELEIIPGNAYGSYNKETKQWDGLVGYLIDRVCINGMNINIEYQGN